MLEQFISFTNLPNLHPAIVHFPIVLLLVGLMIDVLSVISFRSGWLRNSAVLLYVLGAASAGVTFWTGRLAADSIDVPLQAQTVLAEHETLALYTLWFFGTYSVLRLLLHWSGIVLRQRWILILLILISLGGQGLLLATADHGGALVYQHGVAVLRSEPPEEVQEEKPPASTPTREGESVSWNFGPGAETQVSQFLEVPVGSLDSVLMKSKTVNDRSFLALSTNSEETVILAFKPEYQDVQVEAELDLRPFNGSVGLVHHVDAGSYDFFRVSGKNAVLGRITRKKQETFSEEEIQSIPEGFLTLKAVSAGRHFRGYLNGELVTHGHGKEAPAGKAGILFKGTGTIRLASLKVFPLSQETNEH